MIRSMVYFIERVLADAAQSFHPASC